MEGKSWCWILEKDDTVRYTYQIDFNPSAKNDPRYKETFAEMGWEYISSTFNGWHYFKKPYKEGQQLANGDVVPSERIYTDEASYKEMENRWQKLGKYLSMVCLLMFVLYLNLGLRENKLFLGHSVCFLLFGTCCLSSIRNYNKKAEDPNYVPKINIPFRVVLPLFIGILILIPFCKLFF